MLHDPHVITHTHVCVRARAQVMGDKGFNEKNFKLMRESMEAMKAQREAEEAAAAAGADGEDEPPGGRRKASGESSRAWWACWCRQLAAGRVVGSAAPCITMCAVWTLLTVLSGGC